MAKPNLTALVRDVVTEVLPAYRLAESVGGSAPQLLFLRPGSGERPLLREYVWFSKLRWGIPEIDIGLDLKFLGPAVAGTSGAYVAAPLGAEQTRLPADASLADTLRRELPTIDRRASEVFSRWYSLYPQMERLGNELPQLYISWRDQLPAELKDVRAMIANAPELQGVDEETAALRRHKLFPYPSRQLQERRLAHFRGWLVGQRLLTSPDDPAAYWLSAFWSEGRPRTDEEFKTDKNLGDECARCHETRTRGRVVTKMDAVFGAHGEFICTRCERA